jgi:hypothetical protein
MPAASRDPAAAATVQPRVRACGGPYPTGAVRRRGSSRAASCTAACQAAGESSGSLPAAALPHCAIRGSAGRRRRSSVAARELIRGTWQRMALLRSRSRGRRQTRCERRPCESACCTQARRCGRNARSVRAQGSRERGSWAARRKGTRSWAISTAWAWHRWGGAKRRTSAGAGVDGRPASAGRGGVLVVVRRGRWRETLRRRRREDRRRRRAPLPRCGRRADDRGAEPPRRPRGRAGRARRVGRLRRCRTQASEAARHVSAGGRARPQPPAARPLRRR